MLQHPAAPNEAHRFQGGDIAAFKL